MTDTKVKILEKLEVLKNVSDIVFAVYAQRIRDGVPISSMRIDHGTLENILKSQDSDSDGDTTVDDFDGNDSAYPENIDPSLTSNGRCRPAPITPDTTPSVQTNGTSFPSSSKSNGMSDPTYSAATLKRKYEEANGVTKSGRRLTGEHDPENHEIMRLRQQEDRDFDEIARMLNEKRTRLGKTADLTSNAIYGRYKRNAPLIAAANGEDFTPTKKDQKYSQIKFVKVEPVRGFDAREDAMLVQAHNEIREEFWHLVSHRIEQLGGRYHPPDFCARRFDHI